MKIKHKLLLRQNETHAHTQMHTYGYIYIHIYARIYMNSHVYDILQNVWMLISAEWLTKKECMLIICDMVGIRSVHWLQFINAQIISVHVRLIWSISQISHITSRCSDNEYLLMKISLPWNVQFIWLWITYMYAGSGMWCNHFHW